jgi:hypothetical protein
LDHGIKGALLAGSDDIELPYYKNPIGEARGRQIVRWVIEEEQAGIVKAASTFGGINSLQYFEYHRNVS